MTRPATRSIPQNPDIRFLGKLLGDVIRAYGGKQLFERIEAIRSTSVDRHRGLAGPLATAPLLEALSLDDTLAFVRGFMLFSMLANLAEDRQGVAREPGAELAAALDVLRAEGIDDKAITDLLDHALVAPVLTAHPTEVRRKSMIDHRNRIAELMRRRDARQTLTPDGDLVEEAILRQIALLWQTRPLRRERLYVADEVAVTLRTPEAKYVRSAAGRRASCGRGAGSAAIATAIPTSPPHRCGWRWPARPKPS